MYILHKSPFFPLYPYTRWREPSSWFILCTASSNTLYVGHNERVKNQCEGYLTKQVSWHDAFDDGSLLLVLNSTFWRPMYEFQNASTSSTVLRQVTFCYGARILDYFFTWRPLPYSSKFNINPKKVIRTATAAKYPILIPPSTYYETPSKV